MTQSRVKISTVIFDLSEVLLTGLLGMQGSLAFRLGVKSDELDFRIPELQLLFEGRISEESFWVALLKEKGWVIEITELKRLVRENFNEIDGSREIAEEIKKAGYKVALLSVHASEWIEFCEKKFQYSTLFDEILYSYEIGICKPDKRVFEIFLDRLSVLPGNVLFIDDLELNINSAKDVGMQTILFKSAGQLRNDLRDQNLLSW